MLDDLVERRIREALVRGEFENLPGCGKPLPDEDVVLVPAELRVANRILKNAGLVPPEVDALRIVNSVIARESDSNSESASRARRRLLALRLALEQSGIALSTVATVRYQQALLSKLQGRICKSASSEPAASAAARHD